MQKELTQLRAKLRSTLGIDEKKLPRLDHEQHPDDFSENEAKTIAYMTIERLFPDRPRDLKALTEWEQRLYRLIYKYLRVPINSPDDKLEAPTWLRSLLSKIDQITHRRRVKLGLQLRCTYCRLFFNDLRKRRNHQKSCNHNSLKAFINLPDNLPTIQVAKDQDIHNIVHFDHEVTFCEVPTHK